ncbi:O-antigen ligase family protein [Sphingomonas histidinilytica]|uniref:O-antigen ligase family protein n=1 Tax=Rhizorhabdus histidinilytica TaxID=439228 RepID=UPI001ADB87DC|nr:O-antigen ligase family protein [Rhizorhabdus histidinilytica]MBO9378342.1 O-antigen ligase family protein [Rhizorhabdus histidinilytica]
MNSAPTDLVIARLAAVERPADLRAAKGYDQFFGFAAISLMLFVPQLKSLTPLLLLVLLVFHCVWRREDIPRLLRASSLYLLLPLFAATSWLWSVDPQASRYYGIQFLITALIGCIVGAGLDRKAAMRGVFLAFAVYAFSSLVFGRSVTWGGGAMGNSAFAGLAQAKNTAGDCGAVGIILSLTVLFDAIEERKPWLALLALVAAGVQAEMLVASRSSGAVLAVGIAVPLFLLWNVSRLFSKPARVVTGVTAILGIATAVLTQHIWLPPLVEQMSRAMGKDSTLTGRTYLWGRAAALIDEKPLLGVGYNAFWRKGNLDAEGLWRYAGITSRSGFNFHSTPTELLVHLGYVGLTLFVMVFVVLSILLLVRTMIRPDAIMIGWCTLLTYEVVRMPFESIGTGPFHYTTSLLAAGLVVSAGWLARGYRPAPLSNRPRRFRGEREPQLHTARTA